MSTRKPAGPRAAAPGGAGAGGGRRRASGSGAAQPPRHVRMIQEELARVRAAAEAAERRAREEEARRAEEERRAKEEEARRAEDRRVKEERRRRRQEEGRKRAEREERRRVEAARRRLGVAVVGDPGGDGGGGAQRRPVYETRKAKSQPKRRDNAQPEAGETQGLKPQLEDEQSNSSLDNNGAVRSLLELEQEQITPSSSEEGSRIDDEDDGWENKSWDVSDVLLHGKSLCSAEEVEETESHVTCAARNSNSTDAAQNSNSTNTDEEIEEDEVSICLDDGLSNGVDRELRAPICCILGHVDAGKTKLLDSIRHTNVQGGEAGGITQQIGATYLPAENIRERTSLKAEATIKVPGLLVIDTPGHRSFSNMRLRGSSLCDVAVVVVDITRGLEKQTVESLDLLKRRNVRFVVALNKVDRLYGWKTCLNAPIAMALKNQSDDVRREFKWRVTEVATQFKECGINTALYYENKKIKDVVNVVPTSAVSGEGIPDLLLLLVRWVPEVMMDKLTYVNTVECTVLEVNEDKDLGTTIDVVLINGMLRKGDQIVVRTKQGPVTTSIRYLLTPNPLEERRAKGYKYHEELRAAQGVKVVARGLQHAIAGTSLTLVKPVKDSEQFGATAIQEISKARSLIKESEWVENENGTPQEICSITTCREGVCVQASCLGTLEAIAEYLKSPSVDIPVSGYSLGPVHKQDVMKATAMLKRKEEYAAILAFGVKVMPEASDLAAESGVKIFTADTIYKLVDSFTDHTKKLKEAKKKQCAAEVVFPCTLKILPNHVYHSKDPIVCDVEVLEGVVKVGTPISVCVPSKDRGSDIVHGLGRISSIKTSNGVQIDSAKKGVVSIKIIGENPQEKSRLYGRHFNASNELLSQISRRSIDVLKEYYRDEMSDENWQLIRRLKKQFGIA
ncbi:hypothetical protein ACP4OV_028109 [Aristida adscensionis]